MKRGLRISDNRTVGQSDKATARALHRARVNAARAEIKALKRAIRKGALAHDRALRTLGAVSDAQAGRKLELHRQIIRLNELTEGGAA